MLKLSKGLHVKVLDDPFGKEIGRGEILAVDDINGRIQLDDGDWYPWHFVDVLGKVGGGDPSQGIKYDGDKPRYSLIPPEAMEQVAIGMTHGANKYSPHNWRKGMKFTRLMDALERHLKEFAKGNDIDVIDEAEGRTQHHLAAVVFNALAIMQLQLEGRTDLDDRFKGPLYGKH